MRMLLVISLALLTACSTAPNVEITPVNITPVTEIKSEPFDPSEVLELADSHFSDENYSAALKEYSRLLTFDAANMSAKLGAGESLLAMGKYENAAQLFWVSNFDGINEIDQERLEIGQILSGLHTHKYERPETAIHDGFLIRPNDARLWNAKGRLHDSQSQWMESLFSYVTALDIGQWRSGTINNMGMSLLLQGRYQEARKKFDQAVRLSPDTEIYDNNRRMTHILLGDYPKALDNIQDDQASDIFNDAGYVAMQSGRAGLAQIFFSKALEISPVHHAKAQANLAHLIKEQSP